MKKSKSQERERKRQYRKNRDAQAIEQDKQKDRERKKIKIRKETEKMEKTIGHQAENKKDNNIKGNSDNKSIGKNVMKVEKSKSQERERIRQYRDDRSEQTIEHDKKKDRERKKKTIMYME